MGSRACGVLLPALALASCGRLGYDNGSIQDAGDEEGEEEAEAGDAIDTMSGLVALYHFNEPSWNGTPDEVIDSSGNDNHGIGANGASTTPGLLDRAGDFFAANAQSVNLGDVPELELDPPFSILLWVNLRSLPSDLGGSFRLFSKSDATGNQREWTVSIDGINDRLELSTDSDGAGLTAVPVAAFSPADIDAWVHVAVVVSQGGEVIGYRDGVEAGMAAINPVIFHGLAEARIGTRNPNGSETDARLDELAVFNRALSPSDVFAVAISQASGDPATEL